VLLPDAALADVAEEKYDLIVVPGGNPTSVKQLAEVSHLYVTEFYKSLVL